MRPLGYAHLDFVPQFGKQLVLDDMPNVRVPC
jgi:hypothetical protein